MFRTMLALSCLIWYVWRYRPHRRIHSTVFVVSLHLCHCIRMYAHSCVYVKRHAGIVGYPNLCSHVAYVAYVVLHLIYLLPE